MNIQKLNVEIKEWDVLGNPLNMEITIFDTSSIHIKYLCKSILY